MLQFVSFMKKSMDLSLLSNTPLFKGLTANEIASILKTILYRTKKYAIGSIIAQSGESVNSLMIVLIGTVKGEMVDYSGRIIKIEDIPAPGALASAFVYGNNNKYPVNVIAVSDAEILVIDKCEFLKLLMINDTVLVNFLDMISNRSQFLSEKIKFLNFKTIKGKLAQYILQLSAGKKGPVRFGKTQNDMADFFGVARPSIARAISEMESEGIIRASGKEVTILNEKKLTDLTVD
jgi:CRP/FNR family transcriptional regulator, dissimilatory nitrate respiration regulator